MNWCLYQCYYPHMSSDLVAPIAGFQFWWVAGYMTCILENRNTRSRVDQFEGNLSNIVCID